MSGKVRAFIAVDVSEKMREALSGISETLGRSGVPVRWVDPFSVHLTIRFMGEISRESVLAAGKVIDRIAVSRGIFDVSMGHVGVFPRWDRGRVIWVGITRGREELVSLACDIESALASEGFPRQKRAYMPHITIGRTRTVRDLSVIKNISEDMAIPPAVSRIDKVILYRSVLKPSGAEYVPLHSSSFTG